VRLIQDRVEHRCEVTRRGIDDAQHLGSRGLLFERFFKVPSALPQFAEQPRILHRDDGLRGEVLQ
jgi:hypothetical protein